MGGGAAFWAAVEQKELHLAAHIEVVEAFFLSPLNLPLERLPGVALKGFAIGVGNVADEAGHGPFGAGLEVARIDHKGVVVRL